MSEPRRGRWSVAAPPGAACPFPGRQTACRSRPASSVPAAPSRGGRRRNATTSSSRRGTARSPPARRSSGPSRTERPQARSERRSTACSIPRSCSRRSQLRPGFLQRDGTACSIPRVPPTPARRRRRSKRMAETRSGEDSVMAHTARLLLTVAFLGGILALPETHAQAPAPRTASEAPAPAARPDIAQLVGDLPAPLPGPAVPAPETGGSPSSCVHCPGRRTSPARCSSRLPRSVPRRPTWSATSFMTRSSIRRSGRRPGGSPRV